MLRIMIFTGLAVMMSVVVFGYFYSSDAVIEELIAASQKNDLATFERRIAFDDLKDFLKEDIATRKQKLGPQAASMGPAPDDIPRVVDYFVKPENIEIFFYYHDEVFKDIPERDFIDSIRFSPPFGFKVTLALPEGAVKQNEMALALRDRLRVGVIFTIKDFSWKITQMDVPLYMVPRHVYNTPAIDIYGPPEKRRR